MENSNPRCYICEKCKKEYTNRQNLWRHKQKYHKNETNEIEINENHNHIYNHERNPNDYIVNPKDNLDNHSNNHSDNETENQKQKKEKEWACKKCNKKFNCYQNRWRHEKNCNENEKNIHDKKDQIIMELKKTISEQDIKIEKIKKELMDIMKKECKVHPQTLNKINKQLNGNNNTITETINSNNTHNTINYNIVSLGKENLVNTLSEIQQLNILKSKHDCLDNLVKLIHFNDKFPQFKNIMITNINNSIAYKYDTKLNKFIAVTKDELLNSVVSLRVDDINFFYEQLENKLDERTRKALDRFMKRFGEDDEFREMKKKDIKFIIYNNSDKVKKDNKDSTEKNKN